MGFHWFPRPPTGYHGFPPVPTAFHRFLILGKYVFVLVFQLHWVCVCVVGDYPSVFLVFWVFWWMALATEGVVAGLPKHYVFS